MNYHWQREREGLQEMGVLGVKKFDEFRALWTAIDNKHVSQIILKIKIQNLQQNLKLKFKIYIHSYSKHVYHLPKESFPLFGSTITLKITSR